MKNEPAALDGVARFEQAAVETVDESPVGADHFQHGLELRFDEIALDLVDGAIDIRRRSAPLRSIDIGHLPQNLRRGDEYHWHHKAFGSSRFRDDFRRQEARRRMVANHQAVQVKCLSSRLLDRHALAKRPGQLPRRIR